MLVAGRVPRHLGTLTIRTIHLPCIFQCDQHRRQAPGILSAWRCTRPQIRRHCGKRCTQLLKTGHKRGVGTLGEANPCVFAASGAAHCCERCIRTVTAVAALVWNIGLRIPSVVSLCGILPLFRAKMAPF